jgi:hypothetical protein
MSAASCNSLIHGWRAQGARLRLDASNTHRTAEATMDGVKEHLIMARPFTLASLCGCHNDASHMSMLGLSAFQIVSERFVKH